MEVRSEGVIIQVVPYGEEHEVITYFGPLGLRSGLRKWKQRKAPLQSLCHYELAWKEGRGELVAIKEASLLDPYLSLRNRLETLEIGMRCLSALRHSQGAAASERLYLLLTTFLEKMSGARDPHTFLSAFYLKLLIHDGLLALETLDLEMAQLAAERSFAALCQLILPPATHARIETLYRQAHQE